MFMTARNVIAVIAACKNGIHNMNFQVANLEGVA